MSSWWLIQELFALVQEYNRIARTCGMDELRITHLG